MSSEPLVTIGIPVYNEEKYLSRAIESVLSQSYPHFQLIVSDNCSTDNSYEIAKQYEELDKRIRVFKHNKNYGPVLNFQYLLNEANTEYFAWLGSHDYYEKDFLQDAISIHQNNQECSLVYPIVTLVNEEGEFIEWGHSDIKSEFVGRFSDALIIPKKLNKCFNIYGVFKYEIIRKIKVEHIYGSDDLQLFVAACLGTIHCTNKIGLIGLLESSRDYSYEARIKSYIELKIFNSYSNQKRVLRSFTYNKHLKYILTLKGYSARDKIKLILKFYKIYKKRYKISVRLILKALLFNGFKL